MAKIRIAQIQDLSLTTTGGVSTITMGKTTVGALNTITPLTTVAQTTATEQTIDKVVVGLKVEGNSLVPVTETLANLHDGFVSETQLNNTLANYVTTESLNNTLGGYYTKTEVDGLFTTKLADYYTKSELDTKFADYYTSAQVDTKFAGYYTKDEIDNTLGNYVLKTDIATSISNDAVDTKVASEKAVKNYVDSKIQAADAMRYKGTVAAESDLPTSAVNGDTYKASTAFTLANGTKVEAGDMLIYNGTSWDVVQGNIDLASLTGATSVGRNYAVKQNTDGNLIVTVDPLNITKDEHYTPTPGTTTTTTGSVDSLNGGTFTVVTPEVDDKGHVIGTDTKTITVTTEALTARLEAIDEAIEDASNAAALVMKREVLTVAAGKTPQTDLSEMPVGDVAITQNGLDLGIGEYAVEGVNVRFNLDVDAVVGDVFVAYYMYNTEAQLPS